MRYDALASGPTVYGYVGGDPLLLADPYELAYGSPEEAAVAALCHNYWISWVTNSEYIGLIISVSGGYDFTPATSQGMDSDVSLQFTTEATTQQHMFIGFITYTTTTYSPAGNAVG